MNEVEFYLEDLRTKFSKIKPEEYCLSYSGGRDSHFLLWFIKEYLHENRIKVASANTLLEHPEIRERMYKYSDVVILPKMKHKEIKEKYGIPCFSKRQDDYIRRWQSGSRAYSTMLFIEGTGTTKFKLNLKAKRLLPSLHKISMECCTYLKKKPLYDFQKQHNLKPIIALRSQEGINRANIKSCFRKDGSFLPIHDLKEDLLREIEKQYNIPVPKIYQHLTRTGCMGCPYGRNIVKELGLLNPAQRAFIIDYFKESYLIKGIDIYQNTLQ